MRASIVSSAIFRGEPRRHGFCNESSEVTMKSNVVLIDRTARVGIGMLALASPLLEIPSYPFNLLGLVLAATGFVGYCPLYTLFTAFAPKRAVEHST
jgi:hypothetical protein